MDRTGNLLEDISGEHPEMQGCVWRSLKRHVCWGAQPSITGGLLDALAGDGCLARTAGRVYVRNEVSRQVVKSSVTSWSGAPVSRSGIREAVSPAL